MTHFWTEFREVIEGPGEHTKAAAMARIGVPGRLHFDAEGKLRGPADITHNTPWPTPDGRPGGFGAAFGGVFHTEVGFEHNVIDEFNNIKAQASAFFSISMTGAIHQYGSVGHDWEAWTQEAGNSHYRGVEHEDGGNPLHPLAAPQLAASAQVFEAMSAFDGWPLQVTDNPNGGRGIILHQDGGAAWGGHACPGPVREKQRPLIITIAKAIRQGGDVPPETQIHEPELNESWLQMAHRLGCSGARLLRYNGGPDKPFTADIGEYVNLGNLKAPLVPGTKVRGPVTK